MQKYELAYLIPANLTEEETKSFHEKIISLIKDNGGIFGKEIPRSKKRLGNPIKNCSQAYLYAVNFQLDSQKLSDLEKKLKEETQILRYIIVVKKDVKLSLKPIRVPGITKKTKTIVSEKEKKVELKEIEEKLDEILDEPK